ncbi:transposase, partial [Kosmotoga arenicorallina]|uniref:transposase n=1 Tax=Kosmotoga arenicorallina TaxID=688066 RepID=UPI000B1E78E9
HFGATRFMFNFFLNYSNLVYEKLNRPTGYHEWAKLLTRLKKCQKYSWLKEINSQTLQQSLKDLDNAFKKFFRKQAKYPRFKKKKSRQTFRVPQHIQLYIKEDNKKYGYIFVPKFREGIRVRVHRNLPEQFVIKNVTFKKTTTNKYYVSIVVETPGIPLKSNSTEVLGIDLGIKHSVILSTGQKYSMPDLSKFEKRLKRLYRSLSKKQKGSRNREDARLRLARYIEKISNIKEDWIHKTTHKIVNENQVGKIAVENLNIKGMLRNHSLAKHIQQQSWYKFITTLGYKAERLGIELVKIDRFFASSQTCSICGYKNEEVKKLRIRKWTCPNCGTVHDRDINAAVNIAQYAQ